MSFVKKFFLISGCVFASLIQTHDLNAHCQMPCGIYHDDMVFDQVDQYVETMYKGISVINDNKFTTAKERNEDIRWVMQKDIMSDETALLITKYFLQQKIKPGEENTAARLASAHRLLFFLVSIKQNTDLQMVKDFANEWEKFKTMFHIEGYECEMEKMKLKKREQEIKKAEESKKGKDHEHNHDGEHDHKH